MRYLGLHHVSILVRNTAQALHFYHDLLGMTVLPNRPDLGYPGAWLQVGAQQIHLLELPNPDPTDHRPRHGGHDRHLALYIADLDEIRALLDASQVSYTLSGSGRRALFFRDPDANAIELIEYVTAHNPSYATPPITENINPI